MKTEKISLKNIQHVEQKIIWHVSESLIANLKFDV
jgi:hypothetical protein